MIDIIRPQSIQLSEEGVIADMGLVALSVYCSNRDAEALLNTSEIFCLLEMNDETIKLIGFASERRKNLYQRLRAINGIGRSSALVVLDSGEEIDILRAIAGKDKSFFREVPGVGPKRIDTIITRLGKHYSDKIPSPITVQVTDWVEARDALLNTGISWRQADSALQDIAVTKMNSEQLFNHALEKINNE